MNGIRFPEMLGLNSVFDPVKRNRWKLNLQWKLRLLKSVEIGILQAKNKKLRDEGFVRYFYYPDYQQPLHASHNIRLNLPAIQTHKGEYGQYQVVFHSHKKTTSSIAPSASEASTSKLISVKENPP